MQCCSSTCSVSCAITGLPFEANEQLILYHTSFCTEVYLAQSNCTLAQLETAAFGLNSLRAVRSASPNRTANHQPNVLRPTYIRPYIAPLPIRTTKPHRSLSRYLQRTRPPERRVSSTHTTREAASLGNVGRQFAPCDVPSSRWGPPPSKSNMTVSIASSPSLLAPSLARLLADPFPTSNPRKD